MHDDGCSRRFRFLGVGLLIAWIGSSGVGEATVQTEQMVFRAGVSTQSTFQHDSTQSIDWVQQRNEVRLELKYRLLPAGRSFGFLETADVNLLYRGRYDPVFEIRKAYRKRNYDRADFLFPEGKFPREFFLDLDFLGPLSMRIGRQQVVWGEADLFRSLDVVNPLRLDQNGIIGEDLADYREPLWIAKGLIDIGQLGPVAETGIEFFYSPNWRPITYRALIGGGGFRVALYDQNNAIIGPLTRADNLPWNQVRHPWETHRISPFAPDAPDQADLSDGSPPCNSNNPNPLQQGCADFAYLTQSSVPRSEIDPDASMFGVRILGKTFAGLDFSLNYLFKRADLPGTALRADDLFDPSVAQDGSPNPRVSLLQQAALAEATPDNDGNGIPDGSDDLARRCIFNNEPLFILRSIHGDRPPSQNGGARNAFTGCELVGYWHPWTHVIGFTTTYNDYNYTGLVFRLEESFSTKEPGNHQPPLAGVRAGQFPTTGDFETHIKRTRQVWRSMLGFDYLRSFPQYMPPGFQRYKYLRTWFYDQWFLSFQFLNEYFDHVRDQVWLDDSITQRVHHWNPVLTFVATGFFLNNLFRPWIAAGYDVNSEFPLVWLQGTYFVTKNIEVRLGEILYLGSRYNESFIFLNKYADRDTLFLRMRYWFL